MAHGKIQVLRQSGGGTVVAVPRAQDHALVELEQVVADQLLDEVAGDQASPPVQQLAVEEAVLPDKTRL